MERIKSFEEDLYRLNEDGFNDIALRLFKYQSEANPVYNQYLTQIGCPEINAVGEIPFLPISFFKTQDVRSGSWIPETTFTSSSTTGTGTSQHKIRDLSFYLEHSRRIFENNFGLLSEMHFLALLPSYLDRKGSSLVAMAEHFIKATGSPHSGFFLRDEEKLVGLLQKICNGKSKVVLLGVTFALLDLAERLPMDLSNCLVIETGGMKGRRREMTRTEVHSILCSRFNTNLIFSEYGMTELLSQAWSKGNGRFWAPNCMEIRIRDLNDPFLPVTNGQTGGINIIDLANMDTCAFIETEDLGRIHQDGSFEVLGRVDNSDVRGCNLLVE